jgi:hypothetical protein
MWCVFHTWTENYNCWIIHKIWDFHVSEDSSHSLLGCDLIGYHIITWCHNPEDHNLVNQLISAVWKCWFSLYSLQLLIPIVSVLKISKEKTARIIPNAVGVTTEDDKHVFCSLLSRDSTYRLMVQVWKTAMSSGPQNTLPITKVH